MTALTIRCNFCPSVIHEESPDLDVLPVLARSDDHLRTAHPAEWEKYRAGGAR